MASYTWKPSFQVTSQALLAVDRPEYSSWSAHEQYNQHFFQFTFPKKSDTVFVILIMRTIFFPWIPAWNSFVLFYHLVLNPSAVLMDITFMSLFSIRHVWCYCWRSEVFCFWFILGNWCRFSASWKTQEHMTVTHCTTYFQPAWFPEQFIQLFVGRYITTGHKKRPHKNA